MSAGKRYKFDGSNIQFSVNWSGDSPSSPITGVTKANPAVVSESTHGRSTGDVIRIKNVVGMTELNDGVYVIEVVDGGSYKLLDVDSTNYGTYVSGGIVDSATFSKVCELTGYNRQGGTSPEIAATSLCSTAQEFEIGLPDFGTVQLDYNFAPQTTVQDAMQEAYLSGEVVAVKVTLPKSGGIMVQLGYVQQTSETAAVGGLWTGSMTLRCTGRRFDFAAT
jgi:hypothetical protein